MGPPYFVYSHQSTSNPGSRVIEVKKNIQVLLVLCVRILVNVKSEIGLTRGQRPDHRTIAGIVSWM